MTMTNMIQTRPDHVVEVLNWLTELQSKTLRGVRPQHTNRSVPEVKLLFTDDTAYVIAVKPGVYFQAFLINTLRRAQPVVDVVLVTNVDGRFVMELRSKTFPLVQLQAVNKDLPAGEFPFVLSRSDELDA